MIKNKSDTENKVLNCAYRVFLLYGYHATTLQQIATEVQLNQAMIHYYFRSKERLYGLVVKHLMDIVVANNAVEIEILGRNKINWFLNTELYNNKEMFENQIEKLYPNDWKEIVIQLKNVI
ncbi:MAG: TetR/AcrR family transcriptional regulator [Paludibacter sp.]|nr:TetR/AcrR family transcriptional regulator [Paludibacter sp.]